MKAETFIAFFLVNIQAGQAGRTGHRVTGIGVTVKQLDAGFGVLHISVVNLLLAEHCQSMLYGRRTGDVRL